MPTIRESQSVDVSRLQPAGRVGGTAILAPAIGFVPPASSQMSPFMQSSLPPVAAGSDGYSRQFYRPGMAQRRFFPVAI